MTIDTIPTQNTPLSRVESLYEELLQHYGDGDDREIRVAAKLLLVALDRFAHSGNPHWESLVDEYVAMAKYDREKFRQVLESNRGASLQA